MRVGLQRRPETNTQLCLRNRFGECDAGGHHFVWYCNEVVHVKKAPPRTGQTDSLEE